MVRKMNRIKLWVFTLLAVGVGFLLLRSATVSRRADAVAALDARLASAAAHVAASTRTIAREASAAAAFVARDEKLVAALHAKEQQLALPAKGRRARPPPSPQVDLEAEEGKLREAAREALSSAERTFGFDLPGSTVVTAGNREWIARKGEASVAEGEAMAYLRGAIGGAPRRGFLRLSGALWYAAAAPAGDGAGIVLLVPLDEGWAATLSGAAGADVTVSAPDVKPVSTAPASVVPELQRATGHAGAADVGRPGKVDVSVGPLALPRLPQPFPGGAPLRARAVPLEGVKDAFVVVSVAAAPALDGAAALFWRGVGLLAILLLVGLVLGLFVRSAEPVADVPEELHAAAARIDKGDFAARAPRLAGKLGTVAAALNKAAELAGPAQASRGAPAPAATGEWYEGPARPAAAPPDAPAAAPAPAPAPAPARSAVAAAAAPASAPAAAFEVDEETHWQQVFQDFLRTRASCGEQSEGLTYDRFRQKLEGNKAQLVSKYGCKTVRFQVYVKDGKAALKATPVK
jgi:hypothetical protein